MDEVSLKIDGISLDKTATVVVDIESLLLQQSTDRSTSGSPKMMKALSRKWSYRGERLTSAEDEDIDDSSKKSLLKVNSQSETLKQSLLANHGGGGGSTNAMVMDAAAVDGRNKKFNRFLSINPRKILCIFATLSSVGTLILIYFTLAINRTF